MTVNFKTTQAEFDIINQIADRGWGLGWLRRSYENRMGLVMDITAVHANGNPLRFEALLQADDFNFAHNLSGICRHLDRSTGQLADGFRPRFSR